MTTLKEIKDHFKQEGTQSISNQAAGYQFVKREEGTMFLYLDDKYKFYRTFDGFCKAVLYKLKRG